MSSFDHRFANEYNGGIEADVPRRIEPAIRDRWFGHLSVSGKLNLTVFSNIIVLAVIAVVVLSGAWVLSQQGQAQAALVSVEVRSNNAAIALVDVVDGLDSAKQAATESARAESLIKASTALDLADQMLNDSLNSPSDRIPTDISRVIEGFRSSIDHLRSDLDELDTEPSAAAALHEEAKALYRGVSSFAVDFHDKSTSGYERLIGNIANFLIAFVVLTIIAITLSLIGARRIVRDVAGMIGAIHGSLQKIAAGDVASHIPGAERKDEIGAVARALIGFRANSLELRDLNKSRVQDAERQLAQQQSLTEQMRNLRLEKSQLLEGLADGFEVSVGELITSVSAASEQLKATSRQMVSLADGSDGQAQDATAAMDQATTNVTAAAAATDELALSINEISRQVSASAELARSASKLVTTANRKMTDLSRAAVEIGEIAGLIQTIAMRTDLLALNASIEAARGGEAGRGFAAVASEVKELAMQTSNATRSVTDKITAMQVSTRSSAGDLNGIVDRIEELEQTAVKIAGAVDQQSASGEELARNIDTVAVGSAQVGDRLVMLREASRQTGTAADDVVSSSIALGTHAEDLRKKAGRFIADVRRSARDLHAEEPGLASLPLH